MARAIDCECGASFTADDDESLFQLGMEHARTKHADMQISEEQGRRMFAEKAHDV
jgi:hypothetical protein